MEHLQPFKNTFAFQPGQEIFYTGDQANAPYWAKIIEVIKPTKYSPHSYRLRKAEPPCATVTVPHFCFGIGIGQRFKTIEQVRIERNIANQKLHNFLRSCK
ncbi:MAG: hypothetical protein ABIQ88_02315 [Chitinophagaceae bacterium]